MATATFNNRPVARRFSQAYQARAPVNENLFDQNTVSVEDIVKTYELNPENEKAVLNEALRTIPELRDQSFEKIYDHIAAIVERTAVPFAERFSPSLDAPISADSQRTLADIIGYEDPVLGKIFDEEPEGHAYTSVDLLSIMKAHLDKDQLGLLSLLLASNDKADDKTYWLNVSPKEIRSNIPEIQRRLDILAQYRKGGKLPIAKRRVKNAWFADGLLKIVFGRRRYEDPLAFFEENKDLYPEYMTSGEFEDVDSGLYFALYRRGLLGKVVQEKYYHNKRTGTKHLRLSEKEIEAILRAHKTFKGRSTKTSRILDIGSHHTVLKYWRMAGLESFRPRKKESLAGKEAISYNKRRFTPKQIAEIIAARFIYGHEREAVKILPYSSYSFHYFWSAVGLRKGRLGKRLSDLERERENNLTVRLSETEMVLKRPRRLNQYDIARIIYAHTLYSGNIDEASKHLPYPAHFFTKVWEDAGLETRSPISGDAGSVNGNCPIETIKARSAGYSPTAPAYSRNGSQPRKKSFR